MCLRKWTAIYSPHEAFLHSTAFLWFRGILQSFHCSYGIEMSQINIKQNQKPTTLLLFFFVLSNREHHDFSLLINVSMTVFFKAFYKIISFARLLVTELLPKSQRYLFFILKKKKKSWQIQSDKVCSTSRLLTSWAKPEWSEISFYLFIYWVRVKICGM